MRTWNRLSTRSAARPETYKRNTDQRSSILSSSIHPRNQRSHKHIALSRIPRLRLIGMMDVEVFVVAVETLGRGARTDFHG